MLSAEKKILRYKLRRILWGSWYLTKIYNKLTQDDPLASPRGKMWIGGFPRSGNTFASSFIEHLTTYEHVEKHLHSPAQVLQFANSGDPGGVVVRNPTDACVSLSIFSGIDINNSIQNYIDFHELLIESKTKINWIHFDRLVKDPLHIIEMFGLEKITKTDRIQQFRDSPNEFIKAVYDRIDRHWSAKPSDLFLRQTARPTTARAGLKSEIEEKIYKNPVNKKCLDKANELHCKILSQSRG